jgi:hypothetical protein
VLKLAKKAFPLDRAMVIAILPGPCMPLHPSWPRRSGFHDKTTGRVLP